MSQYPPPPQQPPYPSPQMHYDYYRPAGGVAGSPAKRASVLMFVMGGLMILMGGCFSAMGAMLPSMQIPPDSQQALQQLEAQFHPYSVATVVLVTGVALMVVALVFLVLGFLVRGGGRVPVMTATVLTGLMVLYLSLNIVMALVGPVANGSVSACFTLIPLGLFVLQLIWLVQALKAGPSTAANAATAMQQYQAQLWHYQQQQQAYQQAVLGGPPLPPGAGYAPPPPQPAQQAPGAYYGQAAPPAQGYTYGYGAPQPPQQQPTQPPAPAPPERKDPDAPPREG